MTRNVAYLLKVALGIFICLVFSLLVLLLPLARQSAPSAYADEEPQSEAKLTALQLQEQIEAAQVTYGDAREEAERVNEQVEENRQKLAELESQIPEQQERSGKAARDMYKFQNESVGIVELLLSSESLHDFLVGLEYVTKVSDANMNEMNRLYELKAEIEKAQTELEASYSEANARVDEARMALEDLEAAQAEVQRRIEEEARQAAEVAAKAKAQAEAPRANDDESTSPQSAPAPAASSESSQEAAKPEGGNTEASSSENTEAAPAESNNGGSDNVNAPAMSGDEAAFVAEWAPRIDAYLAGSPLAGQGTTFARAAFTYNVDPRWSPAISFTESSKGAVCFLPYNAWGWGSSSWSSWEEAIDAHVGGLSRGYGYTISLDAAYKYCPPNAQAWYDRTLEQMNMI